MNKIMGYVSLWVSGFLFPTVLVSHCFEFRITGLILSIINLFIAYDILGGKLYEEINKKEFSSY